MSKIDRSLPWLKSHSTPATLKWLDQNYEPADGICIARNTLYKQYVEFSRLNQMRPVNAASFGKIIRRKFPSLSTRRLGTRGQSKYHYYGLTVKLCCDSYTRPDFNQNVHCQNNPIDTSNSTDFCFSPGIHQLQLSPSPYQETSSGLSSVDICHSFYTVPSIDTNIYSLVKENEEMIDGKPTNVPPVASLTQSLGVEESCKSEPSMFENHNKVFSHIMNESYQSGLCNYDLGLDALCFN